MNVLVCTPPGRFPGNRFPSPFPSRWTSLFHDYPVFLYYPYQLAYLSALLKRELPNAQVKMVDGAWLRFSADDYVQYLERHDPDWVVFEVDTVTYGETLIVAREIKRKTGARIIITGQFPTAFPERVLEDGNDYACIGEFEETVLDILQGKDPKTISGLHPNSYRKVLDIDSLPDPEDEDISRIHYSYPGGHRWTRYREIEVYASRGCPYTCDFCVAGTVYYEGINWRFRNPARIINEIETLRRKYPQMEGCFFNEETHIIRKKNILEFCDALIDSGNNDLHFEAMANHQRLDEEILEAIRKAGYYKLRIGIETIDEETGESIGRKTRATRLEEILRVAKKLGIEMYGTFLFGASGSTTEGDRKTIEYGRRLIADDLLSSWQASIAVPHPGTTFYKKAIEHGWIQAKGLEDFNGISGTVVSYPDYSSEQIQETVREMGREFESAKKFDTVRKKKSVAAEKTLLLQKEQEEAQPRLEALVPLFKNGEYKQVVERARSIIEDNPKVMCAYHILGSAYKQLGLKEEARRAFEYIVRTATDYDDALEFADGAHFHLGTMCLAGERLQEALEHFKICMHLNPSHQKAREFYWLLIENEIHRSQLVGSNSSA